MYKLIQVGANTYFIESPAKMGIYRLNSVEVCLIDSGNDKDAGKKIRNIIAENGWTLRFIINTHSNADHIGGNAFLQQQQTAPIYSSGIEACFNNYPILEPSFLYGGYPCQELRNKFLMAQPSHTNNIEEVDLPDGMQIIPLPGHYFGMLGVGTDDGVWFLADCVMGENILNKYHISFIYDLAAYLDTLQKVEALEGKWFIPAHAAACQDIHPLVAANRNKVVEIIGRITEICGRPSTTEQIIKLLFDDYHLVMDWNQYVLVGSTVRSYLCFMYETGKLSAEFEENQLFWTGK